MISFGFGSDFRVYERGQFGEKGAKFLIFGLNEGQQEKMGNLQKKIEEITQMGKEPIIAVIERRGEVVSRQQILQSVWGYDVYPSTRTIDNFILSFRKYFETNSTNESTNF